MQSVASLSFIAMGLSSIDMLKTGVDRLVNLSYDRVSSSNPPGSNADAGDTSTVVEFDTPKSRHRKEGESKGSRGLEMSSP